MRAALAGTTAATVWALQEPLDKRLFRCDYSDIAVLGKAVTRGPTWPLAGFGIHAVNGAMFGLAFYEVRQRVSFDPHRLAVGMALAEHVAHIRSHTSSIASTRHAANRACLGCLQTRMLSDKLRGATRSSAPCLADSHDPARLLERL
jgi:hypothetical protein